MIRPAAKAALVALALSTTALSPLIGAGSGLAQTKAAQGTDPA